MAGLGNMQGQWALAIPQLGEITDLIGDAFFSTRRSDWSAPLWSMSMRKVPKTKWAFTSEMALITLVYLATRRIEKKWNSLLRNWSLTVQQLANKFEGRLRLEIETDN
ncbi:hypothetical protein U3A59_12055 [Algoriphagus sp. E1-3-M2]|nr:hypothetical protein [Algoriphagus sp. E1-3-M2]MEB2785379.1 hypothetical protein [Algoriphagus sp. E1-3-M2]